MLGTDTHRRKISHKFVNQNDKVIWWLCLLKAAKWSNPPPIDYPNITEDNMDDTSRPANGREVPLKAQRHVPATLMFLIQERPTLWYESAADYDAMQAAIFSDLSPRDTVEVLLIKDLVDCFWELRQLMRLKRAAIHDSLPNATKLLCGGPHQAPDEQARKSEFWKLSIQASIARDDEEGRRDTQTLNERARQVGITPDFIHYEAYNKQHEALERISRAIERVVERRDRLLRQIEDRRAALGAMARGLVKREAELIEVEETK